MLLSVFSWIKGTFNQEERKQPEPFLEKGEAPERNLRHVGFKGAAASMELKNMKYCRNGIDFGYEKGTL